MGVVLAFRHFRASAGHKSGRKSDRETPVARSIGSTNSAGTPRLERSSQYQTKDCVVPIRSAKAFWLPAVAQARRKALLDMPQRYSNIGARQPKKSSATTHLNFCNIPSMKVNPKEFGNRVAARREELGMSQPELAKVMGYSQQSISHIEQGKPKRPQRSALDLAKALRTSPEWLCYETGPKHIGPWFFTPKEVVENYQDMDDDEKAAFSEWLVERKKKKAKKKVS